MIVQFSIFPVGGASGLRQVEEVLAARGLDHEMSAVGASIRGDWDEVMSAVRDCHRAVAQTSGRVVTSILIDDDLANERHLWAAAGASEDLRESERVRGEDEVEAGAGACETADGDADTTVGPEAETWARDDLRERARDLGLTSKPKGPNPLDPLFDHRRS